LPEVDGYNLGYLRPGATASLVTVDEYQAPLVSSWIRGAGRVAAISFPLGGSHSGKIRAWPDYGDFVQTLARWLSGEDTPAGLALRTAIDGDRLSLELLYDETWTARIAQAAPIASLAETDRRGFATSRPLVWEKIEPGRFRTSAPLAAGGMVRGAVRVGATALPFGPLSVTTSAEWNYDRTRRVELQQLSMRSGGRERLDLGAVWNAPRTSAWQPLGSWFLALWLVLFVIDAALTRLAVPRWRLRGAPPVPQTN
jgi:hypothetical protein